MTSTVAERVRWLRTTAGLKQRELCRIAGIGESQVSLIERGKRENIQTDNAKAIAGVFGVTLDWLIGGVGDEPGANRVIIAASWAKAKHERREES